jgi:hypothetical protein
MEKESFCPGVSGPPFRLDMVVGNGRRSKPKSLAKLFNVQSVSDPSNRTKLPFLPARTLLGQQRSRTADNHSVEIRIAA